jgi:hypothetical protein
MHIHNTIHVLLSTLSYKFRCLLRHSQGELYRKLKTIVTFYIFLTVHLRIILVSDQLDAQFLL